MVTAKDWDNVLEMFYNETEDLDEIADRCGLSVMQVAGVLSDYVKAVEETEREDDYV